MTLATNRGLLLVGEPGTAKSLLSELIAAAVSGTYRLTVQGGVATTEDQIKHSWNYALLVSEGPSTRSLVPAPMLRGMAEGRLVRFEEITRCSLEVQDSLLSLLSERVVAIPELDGPEGMVFAERGFNVIATAGRRRTARTWRRTGHEHALASVHRCRDLPGWPQSRRGQPGGDVIGLHIDTFVESGRLQRPVEVHRLTEPLG